MSVAAPRPAGFWIRSLALGADAVIFWLVRSSLRLVATLLWSSAIEESMAFRTSVVAFTLLFAAAYTTVLHTLFGRTLGKALVGVRVVLDDGAPVPLGTALLRSIAYGISLLPCGLGFLMAGLRADKRALHDLFAGTRVERTRQRVVARQAAAVHGQVPVA